jgi:hypothetical protein
MRVETLTSYCTRRISTYTIKSLLTFQGISVNRKRTSQGHPTKGPSKWGAAMIASSNGLMRIWASMTPQSTPALILRIPIHMPRDGNRTPAAITCRWQAYTARLASPLHLKTWARWIASDNQPKTNSWTWSKQPWSRIRSWRGSTVVIRPWRVLSKTWTSRPLKAWWGRVKKRCKLQLDSQTYRSSSTRPMGPPMQGLQGRRGQVSAVGRIAPLAEQQLTRTVKPGQAHKMAFSLVEPSRNFWTIRIINNSSSSKRVWSNNRSTFDHFIVIIS